MYIRGNSLAVVVLITVLAAACAAPPANQDYATIGYGTNEMCQPPIVEQSNIQTEYHEYDPLLDFIADILRISIEVMFRDGGRIRGVRR